MPDYVGYFFFSDAQYFIILAVSIFSSCLSMVGSCIIVYLIWKTERSSGLYHRLMFGLSISDLFVTIGLLMQPFLLPQESEFPFASGTQGTCNLLGFIWPFYASSYCYNCFMGIYFMLMVRYGRKEKDIAKQMEPWVHALAFGFPLAYSILCLTMDLINPNPFLGVCNAIPYPVECTFQDDVECESGAQAGAVVAIHDAISLIYVLVGMVSTWLVYWTIRQQSRRMTRYAVDGALSEEGQHRRRQRAVGVQAICYAAAYLTGFVIVILVEILKAIYTPQLETIEDLGDYPFYYAAYFLIWLFFPLQGFLNCFIYIRPRYSGWRQSNPEETKLWVFRMVLSGRPVPRIASLSSVMSRSRLGNKTSVTFTGAAPNCSAGVVSLKEAALSHDSSIIQEGGHAEMEEPPALMDDQTKSCSNTITNTLPESIEFEEEDESNPFEIKQLRDQVDRALVLSKEARQSNAILALELSDFQESVASMGSTKSLSQRATFLDATPSVEANDAQAERIKGENKQQGEGMHK